jgi:hypothetical protein
MSRNPFEIFGLTPSLVKELSEKELFSVLKTMYRSLLKTFHPDSGGKKKQKANDRAVELNLAFEALDLDKNLDSFRRHRKNYLLSHPSVAHQNMIVMRDKLQSQMAKEERLADGFWNYLSQGAGAYLEPIFFQGDQSGPPGISVRNVLLGLQDVAIKNNVRHASWLLGSNYKNMEINSNGEIWVRSVGRKTYYHSENTVLLGSVPKEALNIAMLLERCPPSKFYKSPALFEFDPNALPQVSVMNLISEENFKKHVLFHLHPFLLDRAYLFSLNREEYEASRLIRLEGVIIRMDPLAEPYSSDLERLAKDALSDDDVHASEEKGA